MAGAPGPEDRRPGRGQLGNLIVPRRIEPSVRIASLVLVAALLAACGERAGAGAEPGPDSPVTGAPAPGPTTTPTALVVTPRPGLVDVRKHIWDRAEPVGARKVRVEFWGGIEECEGLDHVDVDESPERVAITLFTGRVPTADVCIEIAVLKSVTVTLDSLLGDRDIVDGAAGT